MKPAGPVVTVCTFEHKGTGRTTDAALEDPGGPSVLLVHEPSLTVEMPPCVDGPPLPATQKAKEGSHQEQPERPRGAMRCTGTPPPRKPSFDVRE